MYKKVLVCRVQAGWSVKP